MAVNYVCIADVHQDHFYLEAEVLENGSTLLYYAIMVGSARADLGFIERGLNTAQDLWSRGSGGRNLPGVIGYFVL